MGKVCCDGMYYSKDEESPLDPILIHHSQAEDHGPESLKIHMDQLFGDLKNHLDCQAEQNRHALFSDLVDAVRQELVSQRLPKAARGLQMAGRADGEKIDTVRDANGIVSTLAPTVSHAELPAVEIATELHQSE